MKNRPVHLLAGLLVMSLLVCGCGGTKPSLKDTVRETGSPETALQTLPNVSAQALRRQMEDAGQLFAVAYLGYHETVDSDAPVDAREVLRRDFEALCREQPFLLEIPRERIIGSGGELYCIVPMEAAATVAVSKGIWDEQAQQWVYTDVCYSGDGEPILLFCNNAGWEPDTQLHIFGSAGGALWYPRVDENQCAAPAWDENGESLFLDFSPYREMLETDHRNMLGEWILPSPEMLAGTTWEWHGYSMDGSETRCRVTFAEQTLSVRWNDGVDAEDHIYPDAAWTLTYEESYAVLTVDFREFAGVLRYDLLYHEDYALLYFGMDVLQERMNIGAEPLCRFLSEPMDPEPVEMLGDWELAWTEVEGYRENTQPGTEYISVFLSDSNGFRITLTDGAFPDKSFYDKELAVYDGTLYSGCGNDTWMAYIGYMGAQDVIYSLTLTQDDMLLMEMYWEIDGGVPMVAHKGYRRVG